MMEVKITYKNWQGEISTRRILPISISCTSNEWHPEEQWLLKAYDLDKDATRSFAMKDIQHWENIPILTRL
jgi:predicted DNA-binding transcriptional regulator YafY